MFRASWLEVNRTWLRISGRSRPTDKGEGAGHPDPEIRGGLVSKKIFWIPVHPLYKHLSCFVLAQSNYLLILANDLAGGLLAWTFAHWTSGFNSNLLSKKNYSSQRNRRDCFWALGDAWMENEMQKFDNWVVLAIRKRFKNSCPSCRWGLEKKLKNIFCVCYVV